MRTAIGIILILTFFPLSFASADAPTGTTVVETDEARTGAGAEIAPDSPERQPRLPALYPDDDWLFHGEPYVDRTRTPSRPLERPVLESRAPTPAIVPGSCLDVGDPYCVAVEERSSRLEVRPAASLRPACRTRSGLARTDTALPATRARLFERRAPLLLAIPLDGVKAGPIERASTC